MGFLLLKAMSIHRSTQLVKSKLTRLGRPSSVEVARMRKEDALSLAELIYDIYKENMDGDKIINGQNNANENEND
jgi:hypothetical protein